MPQRRRGESELSRDHQRIDQSLRLSVQRPVTGVSVVRMDGEIDLAARARITELIQQRLTAAVLHALILDLSGVSFVDSCGMELLLHTQRRTDQRGIGLYVIAGSRSVQRLFEVTGMTEQFQCRNTVAEAVAEARR